MTLLFGQISRALIRRSSRNFLCFASVTGDQRNKQSFFLSRRMAKTFSLEEQLPNLQVPSLETTFEKYLQSVKAVATEEEYNNTEKNCKDFIKNEGLHLQAKLKERERNHRNWVEELWLDKGYLELRLPLQYINFAGISSYIEQFWPPKDGTQIERMSLSLHVLAKFWKMLREEKVEPHRSGKGIPFSMQQLRTAFNTCRVPHPKKDELMSYFKTVDEGHAPSHSIVICRGRLFKVDLISLKTGEPFTPPQLAKALDSIVLKCSSPGPGIAAMTSLDRDSWADLRDHMIEISEANQENLEIIQSAVNVASIDESTPTNFSETLSKALTGQASQRWRDKSYNSIWSKNGTLMANCDHTAVDGMVFVMFIEFNTMYLMQCQGKWGGSPDTDDVINVEELKFKLDEKLMQGIEKGKKVGDDFEKDSHLQCLIFDKFGKIEFKKHKIHPDAFVQICLQLTYMRLHGKPAPTYETATTRQFYHGRTETCRTCTPEAVEFCRAVIENKPRSELHTLLRGAHSRFIQLMTDCQNNKGCDRHLFGLSITAMEEGIPLPKIFTDPMYTKTGGNGNFQLSTSFVGFFNSSGAVAPMVDDGYGVFYRINDHRIVYTLTTWRYSEFSNNKEFGVQLEKSFSDVFDLFQQNHDSPL